MSTNRFKPDRGYVNPSKLPKGPNGRPRCRECGQEVPQGRRTFCGDACVDRWKIKTNPQHVRSRLRARDHEVCRACRLDCGKLAQLVETLGAMARPYGVTHAEPRMVIYDAWRALRSGLGLVTRSSLWDADHIVEVVNGGGECGIENFQTLCLWCHRDKTAGLRKRKGESHASGTVPRMPSDPRQHVPGGPMLSGSKIQTPDAPVSPAERA